MPSKSFQLFKERIADVDTLLEIHASNTGSGRGRRESRLVALHKSSIVLLAAAWESYIESLLEESIQILITQVVSPAQIPKELRKNTLDQKGIKNDKKDKDELYAWKFADQGWRSLILTYGKNRLELVHTPDTENVRSLFEELLGIGNICQYWSRQGLSEVRAKTKLNNYFNLRHKVAHGSAEAGSYTRNSVIDFKTFLDITVSNTDNAIRRYLLKVIGQSPWH